MPTTSHMQAADENDSVSISEVELKALHERCFAITEKDGIITNGPLVDGIYPPAQHHSAHEADARADLARHLAFAAQELGLSDASAKRHSEIFVSLPPWYARGTAFSKLDPAERRTAIARAVPIPPVVMRNPGPVYLRTLSVGKEDSNDVFVQRCFFEDNKLFCALHKNAKGVWNKAASCTACRMYPASEEDLREAFMSCPICGVKEKACLHPVFSSRSDRNLKYLRSGQYYLVHVTRTQCYRVVIYRDNEKDYCSHASKTERPYPCKTCKNINHQVYLFSLGAEPPKKSKSSSCKGDYDTLGVDIIDDDDDDDDEDCWSAYGRSDEEDEDFFIDSDTPQAKKIQSRSIDFFYDDTEDTPVTNSESPLALTKRPAPGDQRPPKKVPVLDLNHAIRALNRARYALLHEHCLREGSATLDAIDVALYAMRQHAE